MKFSDKGIMAYSGTIRGAIAFGLACSLELENDLHKSLLISGTLALVLVTTIVFGALMPLFLNFMKSFDSEEDKKLTLKAAIIPTFESNIFGYDFSHPNFTSETLISKEKNVLEVKKRFSYYISNLWTNFDTNVLKPWLLYDYPNCYEENDLLSKKLIELTNDISREKKRMGENKEISEENKEEDRERVDI